MNSRIRTFLQNYWILLVVIVLKFVLQYLLVNPAYELHRDEFLHLDQARHLAFGFISVPPFTSLISKLIFLFGGGIFLVRFFPAFFGALTIVFAWLIVEAAGGKLVSKILVSMALLFSALLRLNILFQPNSFDILVWTVIFYLLVKYVNSGSDKWLWYLAVMVVLGFYNKYTIGFFVTGLFIGLIITPERKIFTKSSFWKALVLAFILILPNLIWQLNNHFPIVEHMKVLKANQLDNNSSAGFIKSQVFIFFGSLPLLLCGLMAFALYKPFKPYRFIGICFLVVLTLLAILKAKDYYGLGLYPAVLAFAAVFIEKRVTSGWKYFVVPFLIIFNLAVTLPSGRLVMPVMTPQEIVDNKASFEKFGLLRWEDGKNHFLPQDFADMLGWKEMAAKALIAYNSIPEAERENTLVFCYNYGQTGAVNYYDRGKMKEAYSFNTDYIFWLPRLKKIQNIVLVADEPIDKLKSMFKDCKLEGVVENQYAREKNTAIYLLTGADPSVTDIFYKWAEERKKNLDIF
jgi:hypothetical protein